MPAKPANQFFTASNLLFNFDAVIVTNRCKRRYQGKVSEKLSVIGKDEKFMETMYVVIIVTIVILLIVILNKKRNSPSMVSSTEQDIIDAILHKVPISK